VERIEQMKTKRPLRFEGSVGPAPEGPPLARQLSSAGLKIIQDANHKIPLPTAQRSEVGIIFPQLSSFSQKIMIERDFDDESSYLHKAFGTHKINHAIDLYSITPSDDDLARAKDLAYRSRTVVFFCFDAHLHPRQQTLLSTLQNTGADLIVVLMRDPYDAEFLRPQDSGLTAYGFRKCQLDAVIQRLCEH
jgi:hypothetical protein